MTPVHLMQQAARWFSEKLETEAQPAPISGLPSAHLDLLRGLAAVAVLFGHWRPFWWPHYVNGDIGVLERLGYFVTGFPHEAVIMFFVLSGFLVGGSVFRSASSWSWKKYLIVRLSRLLTVLLPALLIGAVFDIIGIYLIKSPIYHGQSVSIYWEVGQRLSYGTLACNILFLQTIACEPFGSNGVLWSLANEFWYYIMFPMIVLSLYDKSSISLRFIYVFIVAIILFIIGESISVLFLIWIMGALIYLLPDIHSSSSKAVAIQIFSLGISLACALVSRFMKNTPSDILFGAAFTLFVWSLCQYKAQSSKFYQEISSRLSSFSYTMYLFHLPALALVAAILTEYTSFGAPVSGVLSLFAVIIFCLLAYRSFEAQTPLVRRTLFNVFR